MGRRAISLGLLLVGSILSACGDDDDAGNTAPANGADASTVGADSGTPPPISPTDAGQDADQPRPPGADRKSAKIGPAGGTLTSADGKFVLTVPAGALAVETELWIESTDKTGIGPEWAPVLEKAKIQAYELGPSGTTFTTPAHAALDLGTNPAKSAPFEQILTASNGVLERLKNSTYEIAADGKRTFKGDMAHFSPVVRAYEIGDAAFNYTATGPSETDYNAAFEIQYRVTPIGASTVNEKEAIYEHHPLPATITKTTPDTGNLIEVGGAGEYGANGAYFCNYPAGTGSQPVMIGNRLSFYGSDHGFFDTIIGDPTVVSATIEVEHTCKPQLLNLSVVGIVGSGRVKGEVTKPGDPDHPTTVIDCDAEGGTCTAKVGALSGTDFYATPSLGWVFDQWTSATDPLTTPESLNDYLFFIGHPPFTKDRTVTATFVQASKLQITFAGDGSGKVVELTDPVNIDCASAAPTVKCSEDLKQNGERTITAVSDADSTFEGWGGAVSGTQTSVLAKVGAPGTTTTAIATFKKKTFIDPRTADYIGQMTKKADPNGHDPFIWNVGAGKSVTLHVNVDAASHATITAVTAFSPSPWATLTCTIDGAGNCTATGTATMAGHANTPVVATCNFSGSSFNCTAIKCGDDNGNTLPNGPITYQWPGAKAP
ncbi:MAG: hypothetical protein U0270_20350 [Labilithrix sp.]